MTFNTLRLSAVAIRNRLTGGPHHAAGHSKTSGHKIRAGLIVALALSCAACDSRSDWGFNRKVYFSPSYPGEFSEHAAIRNELSPRHMLIAAENNWIWSGDPLYEPDRDFLEERFHLDPDDERPLQRYAHYSTYSSYWLVNANNKFFERKSDFKKKGTIRYTCEIAEGVEEVASDRFATEERTHTDLAYNRSVLGLFGNSASHSSGWGSGRRWKESGHRMDGVVEVDFDRGIYRQSVDGHQVFFGADVEATFEGDDRLICFREEAVPSQILDYFKGDLDRLGATVCTQSLNLTSGRLLMFHDVQDYYDRLLQNARSQYDYNDKTNIRLDVGYCTAERVSRKP